MMTQHDDKASSASIAGWLAYVFNVKESTARWFVNLAAIVQVVVTCVALWRKWAAGN